MSALAARLGIVAWSMARQQPGRDDTGSLD
jgi:hypothetical protein